MNKIEKRFYQMTDLEVRAQTENEGGKARGYAAVFNAASHDLGGFVERIKPGAFTRSLEASLKGERNIFALWSHDMSQPLASTASSKLSLSEDANGLAFEMDTTRMNLAQLSALADGDLRMSFGFSVREESWIEDATGSIERTLIDVELYEVSFTISPAYPDTSAAMRSLEEWRSKAVEEVSEVRAEDAPMRDVEAMRKRVMTTMLTLRTRK